MELRKATSGLVFAFFAAIMVGSVIVGCSSEEFEGPRKTLATRSANDLVEHIKTGGSLTHILTSNNDSVTFYVPVTWTAGWYSYNPKAQINIDKKDVKIRILEYKKNVDPTNYEESHVPPYYRVSPSVSWINGITSYQVDMGYEIVLIDTIIDGKEQFDTLKGVCNTFFSEIPTECIE